MQTRPAAIHASRAHAFACACEAGPHRGARTLFSRITKWVRMPEPSHPVACTYSTRVSGQRPEACDDRSRVRARRRRTVPSFAPAPTRRPEQLQGPGAIGLRIGVWRLAGPTEPAFGAAAWMASNPPTVRHGTLRPRQALGRRPVLHASVGSRSVIGSDVGVVADKNGQATVATETSRCALLRDARRELPV